MATLSDLYTHLKTLCEQWFYNKSTMDTFLGGKISKSNTSGLVKNDGSIDTNNYALSSSIPAASSTTPSADTTNGSVGTGTTWARSNHTHPKSSIYAEKEHKHNHITYDGKYDDIYPTEFKQDNDGIDRFLMVDASDRDLIKASEFLPSYAVKDPNSNNYTNIGLSGNYKNQSQINSAINTKFGELLDIEFFKIVTTLPTASADTLDTIYLLAITGSGDNNFKEYITIYDLNSQSVPTNFRWEKLGEISGSGLSVDWADITNKPSDFPPSSHSHGTISNDGKVTTTGTSGGNMVVTNSSNAIVVDTTINVIDALVQDLITYGSS